VGTIFSEEHTAIIIRVEVDMKEFYPEDGSSMFLVFWVIIACSLVGEHHLFGRTYCLHH
jgi:hypothetical protein